MKRTWIGAVLLAAVLTLGLLAGTAMERWLCPGKEKLVRAGEQAMAGNWAQAQEMTQEVREDWQALHWLTAALIHREIAGQIETGFAQLTAYAAGGDRVAYSALCAALAQQIEAAGKNHGCRFENFF